MTKADFRYLGNEKIVDGIIKAIIYQGRIRFTDPKGGSLVGHPTKLTVDGSGSVEVVFETEEERRLINIFTGYGEEVEVVDADTGERLVSNEGANDDEKRHGHSAPFMPTHGPLYESTDD